MSGIFHINQADLSWSAYESKAGPTAIRFKALTVGARGVPPVQYLEYGPSQTDPVHQHDTGEFFIVTSGHLWVNGDRIEAGGLAFVPANTDYAVRAGEEGVEYFRVVVG
jgi:hypothetical protein